MNGIIHGQWNAVAAERNPGWILAFLMMLALGGFPSCEDLLEDLDSGDPRDRLVDTWKVDETASGIYKSALEIYYVEISKHPFDSNRVLIYNFYNVQADAEAVLSGSTLSLPLQNLQGGYSVRGSGQIQGTRASGIVWTYSVDDGSGMEENLTAVYTRTSL